MRELERKRGFDRNGAGGGTVSRKNEAAQRNEGEARGGHKKGQGPIELATKENEKKETGSRHQKKKIERKRH